MQYLTHPDFMPSVYAMYKKNGKNRKTADKVLSIWAKAQNHNLFSNKEIFTARSTYKGENRMRHCRKYNFSDGCRLITVLNQEMHIFLFLGTHTECDEWLDRHKGNTLADLLPNITKNQILPQKMLPPTRVQPAPILSSGARSDFLGKMRVDVEEYAALLDYESGVQGYANESSFAVSHASFLQNDCSHINALLDRVSFNLKQRHAEKALIDVQALDDFLIFTSAKLQYINQLALINNRTYH